MLLAVYGAFGTVVWESISAAYGGFVSANSRPSAARTVALSVPTRGLRPLERWLCQCQLAAFGRSNGGFVSANSRPSAARMVALSVPSLGSTYFFVAPLCAYGKLKLCFVHGKLNSARYQELLENCLLPYFEKHAGTNFAFQQDNASCHVSRATRAWCAEHGIYLLPWPSCSPDMNPAEHVFSYLAREVYKDSKQYGNRKELEKAISKAFREMPVGILRNHANTQHKRVRELLEKQGRMAHY
ncbi:DDE superfamily endonuclease domain-containing protein [Ditylenchus destructor]|nr:DDE superfamily endonuclease domain-containing protein [Ditylenchus destructor]